MNSWGRLYLGAHGEAGMRPGAVSHDAVGGEAPLKPAL